MRDARAGPSDEADRYPMHAAIRWGQFHRLGRPRDRAPVEYVQRIDDAWVQWSVVEVDATAVPGARGARCLLFSRQDCIRRVWNYPDHWRTLDAEELTALSWHR